eukprot:CAMPEP_0113463406 /NCGR_PEP_ID=MMETSP0014_2-20120614/12632_1 /TAXON_ID=2857 /ORGANISM="Nitzschia sp." /LENGTH=849 /DNA_ID=CAMNT_0000355381 /DNA_START=433 /DNA_END=2979 /DNA_ORIENTATION=- /assembly_acc=CAM_ASM_000159
MVRVGNNAGSFISSSLASGWLWLTNHGLLVVEGTIDTVRNVVDRTLSSSSPSSKQSPAKKGAQNDEFETTTTPSSQQNCRGEGNTSSDNGGDNFGTTTPTEVVNDLYDEVHDYQPPSSLRHQAGYRELNRSLNVTFEEQATNTNNNNISIGRERNGRHFSTPVSRYGQNETSYPQNGSGSIMKTYPTMNNNEGTQQQQTSYSCPRRQSTPHPNDVARKRQLEGTSEHDRLVNTPANMTMETSENRRTPKYRKTLGERRDTPRYVRLSPSRNAADIDTKASFSLQLRKRRMEDTDTVQQKQICESSSSQLSDAHTEQTPYKRRRLNIGGRVSLHGSRAKTGVGIVGSPRGSNNGWTGLSRLADAASHARRNGFLSTTSRNTFTQSSWLSSSASASASASTSRMGQQAKRERQERDRQLWEQLNQIEEKKPKVLEQPQLGTAAPGSVPDLPKPTNERPSSSGAPAPSASTPAPSTAPPAFSFGASTGAATAPATSTNPSVPPSFGATGGQNISGSTSQTSSETNHTKPFSFGGQNNNDVATSKTPTSSSHQSAVTQKPPETNSTNGSTSGSSGAATNSASGSVPTSSSTGTQSGAQPTAPVFGSTPSAAFPQPGQAQGSAQAQAPTFGINNPPEQPKTPGGFQNAFGASSGSGSAHPSSNQNTFSASGFSNTTATSQPTSQNGGTSAAGSGAAATPFGGSAQDPTGTDVPHTVNPFGGNSAATDAPKFGQPANAAPPSGGNTPNPFAKGSAQTNSSVVPAVMSNGLGGGFNGTNQVNGVVNGANFGTAQVSGSTSGMKPFSAMTGTENNPFAAATAVGANRNPTMAPNGFSAGGVVGGGGGRGGAGAGARR